MKTTGEYLEEAKQAKGFRTDDQLAKFLGVTQGALSHYKTGRRIVDDYAAAKIAEAIGMNPLQIIAAANAEREKDEERKGYWENFSKRLAGSAAVTLLIIAAFSDEVMMPAYANASNISAHYANRATTKKRLPFLLAAARDIREHLGFTAPPFSPFRQDRQCPCFHRPKPDLPRLHLHHSWRPYPHDVQAEP